MAVSGDRDLADRRAAAVVAYCGERCFPEAVSSAVISALSAFGAARRDTDEQLLDAARAAAAPHLSPSELPQQWQGALEQLREARATRAFWAATAHPQIAADLVDAKAVREAMAPAIHEPLVPEPSLPFASEGADVPLEPAPVAPAPAMVVLPPGPESEPARRPELREPVLARRRRARPSVLRRYSVFLITLAVGAIAVVAVALALSTSSSSSSPASLPLPSSASTPPAQVGIATGAAHRVQARVP